MRKKEPSDLFDHALMAAVVGLFLAALMVADANAQSYTTFPNLRTGNMDFTATIRANGGACSSGQAIVSGSGTVSCTAVVPATEKGAANGVATLDSGGLVPVSQLPFAGLSYEGSWNANTNSPTLADGVGTGGDFYITSVAGSQDLGSGSISFAVGDWALYNGSVWQKVPSSAAVTSVFGRTGSVTATGGDYTAAEVTNVPAGGVSATDVQAAITELDTDKQAADADLTSWAAITRASGFDTFTQTPSSANLRGLLTDETGTGLAYFQGGALGTPSSGTLTSATGLPWSTGLTGVPNTAVGYGITGGAKLDAYAGGDTPSAFTLGIVDSADAATWRAAIGAGTSSATAAGSDTQVQFNNSGSFGASSGLTWASNVLSATNISVTGTAPNTFLGDITINSTAPQYYLNETDAAVDTRESDLVQDAGVISGRLLNDAHTVANPWFSLTRTTTTPGTYSLFATSLRGANGSAASPFYSWTNESDSGWYTGGAGNVSLSVDGAQRLSVSATNFNVVTANLLHNAVPVALSDGTNFPATLPVSSGVNLTDLNASNLASGTVADARLSSNVPLKNAANVFTSAVQNITATNAQWTVTDAGITTAMQSASSLGAGLLGTQTNHPVLFRVNGATVATLTAGLQLGSPTGGDLGVGTLNTAGNIAINNVSVCRNDGTNCGVLNASNLSSGTVNTARLPSTINVATDVQVGGVSACLEDGTNCDQTISATSVTATTGTFTNATVGGSNVCRSDGTNCPSGSGVSSITGTSNQVIASASTGAVTLSLPQSINTGASVRFGSFGVGTAASGTTGEIRATNNVTAYYSSDARLKENVTPIRDALAKLGQINGVEFDWTDQYISDHGGEDDYFLRRHDVGVIAQEVQAVLPEVVATRDDGTLAVKYDRMVPLLIEAIKELKAANDELYRRVQQLEGGR